MPITARENKKYSAELKIQAVEEYLSGNGSQREICRKHGISAKRTLEAWIMGWSLTGVRQEHVYIVIEFLNTHKHYSVKEICIAFGLNRSSYDRG